MESFLQVFGNEADDIDLSPEQARAAFKLLGLELTDDQIMLLENAPIDRFLQTLDAQPTSVEVTEEAAKAEEDAITYNQLHEFLQTCRLDMPQETILQFLAMQSNSSVRETDPLFVDKDGFN
ncbi:hypothetical protein THRCLA_21913, partial [Thraustotheca clavata]